MPQQSPLHESHLAFGAAMTTQGEWETPSDFGDPVREHLSVRSHAGLFDLSYMPRFRVTGQDRCAFLQSIFTNTLEGAGPGKTVYGLFCNEEGGVVIDATVFEHPDCLLVRVGDPAGRILSGWMEDHRKGLLVRVEDATDETAVFILQGPESRHILSPLAGQDAERLFALPPDCFHAVTLDGHPAVVSRANLTGEGGYEIICGAKEAAHVWRRVLEAGKAMGLRPAGTTALETLRIEACLPRFGHELTAERSPVEAGLSQYIDFKKRFLGRGAIITQSNSEYSAWLAAFEMVGDQVPEHGCEVEADEQPAGLVTSAAFSPTLKKCIGMAYVARYYSLSGRAINIRINRQRHPAFIVKKPHCQAGGRVSE